MNRWFVSSVAGHLRTWIFLQLKQFRYLSKDQTTNTIQQGKKMIPYLRIGTLKKHTLSGGTCLSNPYTGVPPRKSFQLQINCTIRSMTGCKAKQDRQIADFPLPMQVKGKNLQPWSHFFLRSPLQYFACMSGWIALIVKKTTFSSPLTLTQATLLFTYRCFDTVFRKPYRYSSISYFILVRSL